MIVEIKGNVKFSIKGTKKQKLVFYESKSQNITGAYKTRCRNQSGR